MRRWLVGAGLALTVVLVGVSAVAAVNAMSRQTVQEEHVYGFKGKAVSIELTVGDVAIVPGTVDDQILVRRRLTYGLRRPFVEERIDGETFRIRDGDCAMPVGAICHVRWLVQVPPKLHLSIATNAGDIRVSSGMTGAVNLTSMSGRVEARGLAGPAVQLLSHKGSVSGTGLRSTHVVATSETGNILVTFRQPPKFVLGKTKTGSVEVLLPEGDEAYKITAKAGGIRTIAAKEDDSSSPTRKINVESQKGPGTIEHSSGGPSS
jgi:hypothetical protein